ncbi:hypothetical protein ACXR2U_07035 [Jatrophihabitans sp. YIM 134969]
MTSRDLGPAHEPFLAAAAATDAARNRAEVDLGLARELLGEAAVMLHNGLACDGLDEHDQRAVIDALCIDLLAPDPGTAVRARGQAALDGVPGDLHDPEAVFAAHLTAAAILRL